MDDLDRLFTRLVENIRAQFPEYLARPFEVAELYQTLIPYRHYRRELGIETNGDYEVALLRLLSGERGFLQVEPTMQEAMERELTGNNPNTALFREFAASRVSLSPDAARVAEQMAKRDALGTAIGATAAFGASAAATAPPHAAPASTPPAAAPAPPPPPRAAAPAPPSAPASAANTPGYGFASAQHGSATPAGGVPRGTSHTPPTAQRATPHGLTGGACPYCNGALPTGRKIVFCPNCGQNLTIQRCPACGTELEMGWKFCITCGRGMPQPAESGAPRG